MHHQVLDSPASASLGPSATFTPQWGPRAPGLQVLKLQHSETDLLLSLILVQKELGGPDPVKCPNVSQSTVAKTAGYSGPSWIQCTTCASQWWSKR